MPSNSRSSLKDNFFDKNINEEQIFDDVNNDDLLDEEQKNYLMKDFQFKR